MLVTRIAFLGVVFIFLINTTFTIPGSKESTVRVRRK
jgi:hypothetical protein